MIYTEGRCYEYADAVAGDLNRLAHRRTSNVALQCRVGILPGWLVGYRVGDRDRAAVTRKDLRGAEEGS